MVWKSAQATGDGQMGANEIEFPTEIPCERVLHLAYHAVEGYERV